MTQYIPKHKVTIKTAPPGEFIYKTSKQPFSGTYMETSEGKFYQGNDTLNPGAQLKRIPSPNSRFGRSRETIIYKNIRPDVFNWRKKMKTPYASKSVPKQGDYWRGYYHRYVCVRNNNPNEIFEISKKTYNDIVKKPSFDNKLYNVILIAWTLRSKNGRNGVKKTNMLNLNDLADSYPRLPSLFPIHDEFYKDPQPQEGDAVRWNITGRFYKSGVAIPTSLPPSYQLGPMHKIQKCVGCTFFKEGMCSKWNAMVMPNYWCKSFIKMGVKENFDDPLYALGLGDMEDFQKSKDKEGYWKYGDKSTVYYTDIMGITIAFSSEEEFFDHRESNGGERNFDNIKSVAPGEYFKYPGNDTVYFEDLDHNLRAFSSPEEYYVHRESMGQPRDWSNIVTRHD